MVGRGTAWGPAGKACAKAEELGAIWALRGPCALSITLAITLAITSVMPPVIVLMFAWAFAWAIVSGCRVRRPGVVRGRVSRGPGGAEGCGAARGGG